MTASRSGVRSVAAIRLSLTGIARKDARDDAINAAHVSPKE